MEPHKENRLDSWLLRKLPPGLRSQVVLPAGIQADPLQTIDNLLVQAYHLFNRCCQQGHDQEAICWMNAFSGWLVIRARVVKALEIKDRFEEIVTSVLEEPMDDLMLDLNESPAERKRGKTGENRVCWGWVIASEPPPMRRAATKRRDLSPCRSGEWGDLVSEAKDEDTNVRKAG